MKLEKQKPLINICFPKSLKFPFPVKKQKKQDSKNTCNNKITSENLHTFPISLPSKTKTKDSKTKDSEIPVITRSLQKTFTSPFI